MVRGELVGGRFYIDRCVHRSTTMAVYRAVDSMGADPVVVRVFPELSSAGAAFLERVCSALWQRPHPCVERLVAWGRANGGEGYTAAIVPVGPSLEEALTDGLPNGDVYHVFRRTLEALAHLHDLGLAHGNVSGEAIVLPRGMAASALLIDTTLVPAALSVPEASVPSFDVETAKHLAPERVRSGSGPSPAADLFSLGCVLYQALAGAAPFAGSTAIGLYLRILYTEPKSLEELGRAPRGVVEQLTRRMLSKDPAARPSARDALAELAAFAQQGPTSATQQFRARGTAAQPCVGLVLCRLLLRQPPSLESEADLDQLERLLEPLAGRVDRLVGGLLLVEVSDSERGDVIVRAAEAAVLLQRLLPLAAVVVAHATPGSAADLDAAEALLTNVRPGQIALLPGVAARLGNSEESAVPSQRPSWDSEPQTRPRPLRPAQFDADVTVSESGQITMEISVPEGLLDDIARPVPASAALGATLDPLPTIEMDLGPLARSTLSSGIRSATSGDELDAELRGEPVTIDRDERRTIDLADPASRADAAPSED